MPVEQSDISKKAKTAHLRPHQWRKGQSGNPNGRPKGRDLETLLYKELHKNGGENLKEIVAVMVRIMKNPEANQGLFKALCKPFLDRVWPIIQQHQIDATMGMSLDDSRANLTAKLQQLAEVESLEECTTPEPPEPLINNEPTYQHTHAPAEVAKPKPLPIDDDDYSVPEGIPERNQWIG